MIVMYKDSLVVVIEALVVILKAIHEIAVTLAVERHGVRLIARRLLTRLPLNRTQTLVILVDLSLPLRLSEWVLLL
jgi:hypothetical protein